MEYFIQIFGCQMNRSDSERIATLFESLGMRSTDKMEKADVAAVVMCSVRQMAADRVFGLEQKFKQIKKLCPEFKSILTGCVVENDKERFAKIFDHILDIKTLNQWPKLLDTRKSQTLPSPEEFDPSGNCDYFSVLPKNSSKFSALVPISKGCDNFCTYCVVPYTRGPLESRAAKDILNEVKTAVNAGAKEIWLLGQNVNNYHDNGVDFAELLRLVNDVPGDFWIRFTSPHPKDFNDNAVKTMAQCQKVTPYLNLPIQSGDSVILKTMRRPYTVAAYKTLVKKIRQAFKKYRHGLEKEVAISTDVIVGFPGETKTQFSNTAKAFKEIKYDMAYISQYSKRAGTVAGKMDDNVAPKEKKLREEAINDIVKITALSHNKKYTGKTVVVLVDSIKNGIYGMGKTRSYKTVKFPLVGSNPKPGDIVSVKIEKVQSFGLIGKLQ
ncbi:MAG: MiaB/RimO family radical SAM methylthiotransferase [Candidatus Paceibacterota bacterium]